MDDPDTMHTYSVEERRGMIALTTIGGLSFLSILSLVLAMIVHSCRRSRKKEPDTHRFVRTPVGVYFLSLLMCDFAQSIASMISIDWIVHGGVTAGGTCTAQGVIYQLGNVGSALWSLTIAVHTFALLFLRIHVSAMACLSTFVGVWFITGAIVAIGPALVQNSQHGPFHGLSGPWCWITEEYTGSRLGLEYFWMFFSAFLSFILYTLVFLRLRGNIAIDGWNVSLRWVSRSRAWNGSAGRETVESHVLNVARQMLWYPVAYTIVILPVAICRWTEFSGGRMPMSAIFATDAIFLLSGAVNVLLFTTTRRVIPKRSGSLPISSKTSTKDAINFVIRRRSSSSSQQSSDGGYDVVPLPPKSVYTPTVQPRPQRLSLSPLTPPDDDRHHDRLHSPSHNAYFFAPSSPELRSIHSVAFSELSSAPSIPAHLRAHAIPIVITTPPSPSPSQRTQATATTFDPERERQIAEVQATLPALTRF